MISSSQTWVRFYNSLCIWYQLLKFLNNEHIQDYWAIYVNPLPTTTPQHCLPIISKKYIQEQMQLQTNKNKYEACLFWNNGIWGILIDSQIYTTPQILNGTVIFCIYSDTFTSYDSTCFEYTTHSFLFFFFF